MTDSNYQEFRANVLFIWLCCNGAYFYIVLGLSGSNDPTLINDGSIGALQIFTMILAGMVIFRVIFSTIYVIKWKCRYNRDPRYKIKPFNLEKIWQKRSKKDDDGFSSDDEEIHLIAERICLLHDQDIILQKISKEENDGDYSTESEDIYIKSKRLILAHEQDIRVARGEASSFDEKSDESYKLKLASKDDHHYEKLKKRGGKANELEFEDNVVEEARPLIVEEVNSNFC